MSSGGRAAQSLAGEGPDPQEPAMQGSAGEGQDPHGLAARLLLVEGFFCEAAIALFDANGTAAMFVSSLGASAWQIGVMSAVALVGLYVPQVFIASRFRGKLSSVLVKVTSIQWLASLGMAVAPALAYAYSPGVALTCFMIGRCCFALGEGAAFVPWSETMAFAVGRKCGGFLGTYGFMGSLGTMVAGVAVLIFAKLGLMGGNLGYALIFGLGSFGMLVTLFVLDGVQRQGAVLRRLGEARMREQGSGCGSGSGAGSKSGFGAGLGTGYDASSEAGSGAARAEDGGGQEGAEGGGGRKRAEGGFRAFAWSWLLSLTIYLVAPFVLLYGCEELGLTAVGSGVAVWAEITGMALGSILAARLADRWGSGAVVRLSCVSSAAVPLLVALPGLARCCGLSGYFGLAGQGAMAVAGVMAAMLNLGVFQATSWAGCTGYVVEHAVRNRPMVIALINLMALPFACLGPVGGLMIKQAGYAPVFGVAAVPCLISAMIAFRVD